MTVMTWGGLVAALGFALAGLSVQHLSAMSLHSNRQEAQNLARSAVSKAIERLLSQPSFGKAPPAGQMLKIELTGSRPGALGLLTFHPGEARDNGIDYSVNNLEGTQPVIGALQRPVAAAQAQLIGEGRCGGVVRKVVAVLAVPPFPYAIASAGPVSAQGGLTLGSLEAVPSGDISADTPLLPADLLSNFAGSNAIFLGANTHVSGDVKAPGGIDLDPAAPVGSIRVEGLIESGAAPESLPKIPLSDYDPQQSGKDFTPLGNGLYTDPLHVSGVMRRQGNLEAENGLALTGGLLFVDGDLTVHKGLTGQGVVACTGKVTLEGQNRLVSGNGVALLTGKDLTISGRASDESYFQGLVYTEGTFQANRVSIVGTLIAAGQNDQAVTLRQSRVLQAPDSSVTVTLKPPAPGSTVLAPFSMDLWGKWQLQLGGSVTGRTINLTGTLGTTPLNLGIVLTGPTTPNDLTTKIQQEIIAAAPFPGLTFPPGGQLHGFSKQIMEAVHKNLGSGSGTAPVVVTVNPSSFMRIQDRVRVVLWKEEI